jgi:hypothetical protein
LWVFQNRKLGTDDRYLEGLVSVDVTTDISVSDDGSVRWSQDGAFIRLSLNSWWGGESSKELLVALETTLRLYGLWRNETGCDDREKTGV